MSNNNLNQSDLLKLIPVGANRVQVIDIKGKTRYKDLDKVVSTDKIQINKKGEPIVMMVKPGRKLKDGPVDLEPINGTVADILKKKKDVIVTDPLLRTAQNAPESTDLLHHVMVALAEEAASIRFERSEAERMGEETSNISSRRINALKTVVDTWLKRKDQVSANNLDLKSPATRALFLFIFEMFREAMDSSGLAAEMSETIFAKVAKTLESDQWVSEARNRMKSAV